MSKVYRVAGYVKLAKLWQRSKEQALEYHRNYYEQKYDGEPDMELVDVYIDITGQKQIYKRKEMLRLLRDCTLEKINCIATQTRAYLAANHEELCYLLYFLMSSPHRVDIVTEDDTYQIDTITNPDKQWEALFEMAKSRVHIDSPSYESWKSKVVDGMNKLVE